MGNHISWDVALIVESGKFSLSDLATRLERNPQSGSHDKGTPRFRGLLWERTYWRENARKPDAPLQQQCWQVLEDMPPKCSELIAAEPDDVSIYLCIAGFFETAYFSLILPHELIRDLSAKGVGLEIVGYPCGSDEACPSQ